MLALLSGALGGPPATAGAEPVTVPDIVAAQVIEPPVECAAGSRPYPVVVLPGADGTTADTAAQWAPMVDALQQAGACVLVFQGGIIGTQRWAVDPAVSARQVAQFVDEVRAVTGAPKVDIVAHSAGAVIGDYYVKVLGGFPNVHSLIQLAPETHGSDGSGVLPGLPVPPAQLVAGLPIAPPLAGLLGVGGALGLLSAAPAVTALGDGPIAQPGVEYSIMATRNDTLATPVGTSSFIDEPGVTNVFYEDQFPGSAPVDHSSLRSSPNTTEWVVAQLYR
ncbi:hypothetical protein EBN03_09545 [Nocardia stercoris]|uniref:Lipase n=1 Tax=Nocardia stercoris TaxID=2483361 RepID=A0A3M2L9J0_9NOCA|nr:hypothetical protein EBN03_09545 [Nocardia stercoris]